MSELQISLSAGERDLLVRMLSAALKEKQVEVHRAEFSREFRNQLEAEETRIRDLLEKLSQKAGTT
jgi:hypothetical protein